jgi:molecular chaperone DnaK (HSP70)
VGYALGVDLGTTYTAAATWRDGRTEVATLGSRSASVPSIVLMRDADTVLTGEAAERRAATEPDRVAREFKRRVGDTTPIFLGGSPYSAELLMSELLQWVIDEVSEREGGAPDRVAVSHPANWGAYKRELLDNAIRQADLAGAITLSEPEAAAIHYASTERVDAGDTIAVYDLGGGTFDAAVLRKTDTGWETLGSPEGIERLGGIDFDAAVFAHVQRSLGGALEELDEDDPTAMAAVGRLRLHRTSSEQYKGRSHGNFSPKLIPKTLHKLFGNRYC